MTQIRESEMTEEQLKDRRLQAIRGITQALEIMLNGNKKDPKERKTGYILLLYPLDPMSTSLNIVTNQAEMPDVIAIFKEQIAIYEGQARTHGNA